MRNSNKLALIIIILFCQTVHGQMSGVYTIGGSTGSRNFTTWTNFATAFNSSGVNGKTDVYVIKDLTETNVVELTVPTSNPTTASNSLTIHGNGYSIIGGGSSVVYEIMTLNGVDWINFKSLKFINSRTFNTGICLRIINESTDINIDSCTFEFSALSTFLAQASAYISTNAVSTSLTSISTTTPSVLRMIISNCRFQTTGKNNPGPKYGIICSQLASSNSNAKPTEVSIINNIFTNFFTCAIYSLNPIDDNYSGNNISRSDITSGMAADTQVNGIYVKNSSIGTKQFKITKNYIHDLPFVGYTLGSAGGINTFYGVNSDNSNIYVTGKSKAYHRILITDNVIARNFSRIYFSGITVNTTPYSRVLNNKIIDNSMQLGSNKMMYVYGADNSVISGNEIRRNNFNSNTLGHCVALYVLSITDTVFVTKNIFDSNFVASRVHMLNVTLCTRLFMHGNIITNNYITNNGIDFTGVYFSRVYYLRANSNLIAKNQGGNSHYSFYILDNTAGTYDQIYQQNTVQYSAKNVVTKNWGWYFGLNHACSMIGNITVNTGTSTNYLVESSNAIGVIKASGNLYYSSSTGYSWKLNTSIYTTLSNWQSAIGSTQEYTGDPKFLNPSKNEFYPMVQVAQNIISTQNEFPNDLFGGKRAKILSDIGALESYGDIQLNRIYFTFPSKICYNSTFNFKARIKNLNVDTIKNLKFNISINNSKFLTIDKIFSVNPLDTALCDFDTKGFTWLNGKNTLKIYLSLPNDSLYNDSITYTFNSNKSPGGVLKSISSKSLNSPVYYPTNIPDVTILNLPWSYSIPPPSGYSNSDYGTSGKWYANAIAKTKSGTLVKTASVVPANGSNNAEWTLVVSDSSLQDSTLSVELIVSDLVNGCDTTYHREVYLWPVPVQIFNYKHEICQQDIVMFYHTTTSKYGTNTFKWNFGTGPNDTSISNIPQKRYDTAGVFKLSRILYNNNYKFKFMWYDSIIVNGKPVFELTNTPACEGSPFYIINRTKPSTSKLDYDFGSGKVTIYDTQFVYKYQTVGDKTYKVYGDNKGCKKEITVTINVGDRPLSKFDISGSYCEKGLMNFINKSTIANTTVSLKYDWKLDSSVKSMQLNPTYKYNKVGQKLVTLIVNSTVGCSDTFSKNIDILPTPNVSFINSSICNLTDTKLTSTTPILSGINAVYEWDLDKGITFTGNEIDFTWSKTGSRLIKLKVQFDNGCIDSLTKIIEIMGLPTAQFQFLDSQCSNDSIKFANLSKSQGNKSMNFIWYFDSKDSLNQMSPKHLFKHYGGSIKSFNVRLKVTDASGCINEIQKSVSLKGVASTLNFVGKPDYVTYYRGIALNPINTVGAEGGEAGVSYKWFLQGIDTQSTVGTIARIVYNVPSDKNYLAEMWATQVSTGCLVYNSQNVIIDRLSTRNQNLSKIEVFPNPSNMKITVKLSETLNSELNIILIDGLGKSIINKKINVNSNTFDIDVSVLSSGIYDLKLINEKNNYSTKLTIIR